MASASYTAPTDSLRERLTAMVMKDPLNAAAFSSPDQINETKAALNALGFTGPSSQPLAENGELDVETIIAYEKMRHSSSVFSDSAILREAEKALNRQGRSIPLEQNSQGRSIPLEQNRQISTQPSLLSQLSQSFWQSIPFFNTDTNKAKEQAQQQLHQIITTQYEPKAFIVKTVADQRFNQALSDIEKNSETISNASALMHIPPEVIGSIIVKEQYTQSIPDWLGNMTAYVSAEKPELGEKLLPVKVLEERVFTEHSVGLGAIFPATARDAWNYVLGAENAARILPEDNLSLQVQLSSSDDFNIYTIGAVLQLKAGNLGYDDLSALTEEQWKEVLTKYNGSSDYGDKVVEYFPYMKEFLDN